MATAVGQKAPAFAGKAFVDGAFKDIKLEDYKGKWVVLFFYPLDFTPVCATEVPAFQDKLAEFEKLGAQVIGCSVDSWYSHKAWVESGQIGKGLKKLGYPLLSDFNKNIARDYGVLNEQTGFAVRGTFLINPEGMLQQFSVHPTPVGRDLDAILRDLSAVSQGKACPVNWHPGQPTL